jgi:hypothetical protein
MSGMRTEDVINAEQARQNMKAASQSRNEVIASLNDAILEASGEHRGHTTVYIAREHIDTEDMEEIIADLRQNGYDVEDRCHDRNTFGLKISWYPGHSRRGA